MKKIRKNTIKANSCITNGYKFRFIIFDKDFNLVENPLSNIKCNLKTKLDILKMNHKQKVIKFVDICKDRDAEHDYTGIPNRFAIDTIIDILKVCIDKSVKVLVSPIRRSYEMDIIESDARNWKNSFLVHMTFSDLKQLLETKPEESYKYWAIVFENTILDNYHKECHHIF